MTENRVYPEQIDALIDEAEVIVEDKFGCMTEVHVKLACGFIVTKTSACIDPLNYDREVGKEICMKKVRDDLWMLEGYHKMRTDSDQE